MADDRRRSRMQLLWLSLACAFCCAVWSFPPGAHAAEQVEAVDVHLELSHGYLGAEPMARLETALNSIVELVILDQLSANLDYINTHQGEVANVLGTVIEEALLKRGFGLEELVIEPGPRTDVSLKFHLAERQAQSFRVQFNLLGNTPVVEAASAEDVAAIEAALYSALARTPYDDGEWLSKLVQDLVEAQLDMMAAYADFERTVLVHPGENTEVQVTFTPRVDALQVRGHTIRLRSATMVNYMLLPVREELAYYLRSLYGAPVSFLEARSHELGQAIYQQVVNRPALLRQQAEAELELISRGMNIDAVLYVNSTRSIFGLNGRLDLRGHSFTEPGNFTPESLQGLLSARGGGFIGHQLAVYARGDFYPGHSEVYPMLGVGRILEADGFLGAGFDFNASSLRIEGFKPLGRDLMVRMNLYANDDYQELSEISAGYLIRVIYELQLVLNLDGDTYIGVAAGF